MASGCEVEVLVAEIESGRLGEIMGEREAHLCQAGLRMLADNEQVLEVADLIGKTVGMPWHDPRVIRAASRIKLLFDAHGLS